MAARYDGGMDPQEIAEPIIVRLNDVMDSTPRNVGVAMGWALYRACCDRGLVSMEMFSVLGSGFLPNTLPAYRGLNFVFVPPDFPEWEFQIGTPNA
jgi:hypothetical protein